MPPQQPETPNQKKILVIEDDKNIADLYYRLLKGVGYNVTISNDGQTGLEEAERGSYSLILLDLMLPGKSGLEILQSWQAGHRLSSTVILVLTNVRQDPIISRCYELGAKGYIVKSSITNSELIQQVNEQLGIKMDLPEMAPPAIPEPPPKKNGNLLSNLVTIFSKKN